MDLAQLSQRALEIRQRYAELEQARSGGSWTREQLMAGFVVDVGELMRLVMAKSGLRDVPDLDRKLEHELADCLWSVLVLAKLYDVDLERAFLRTMTELETKIAHTRPSRAELP
jgi:NTP pyrophosphatase (non-canonical NTP hydrolase)